MIYRIKMIDGAPVGYDEVTDDTLFLTEPNGAKPYFIAATLLNGPSAHRAKVPVYDIQAKTIDHPRLSQEQIAALDAPSKTPLQLIDSRRTAAKKVTLADTINHVADPDARDALKEILALLEK